MTSKAGDARAVIGRIAGTFGLRGEVKVDTTDPSDFRPGLSVRVTRSGSSEARQEPGGDDGRDMVIAAVRPHQRRLLVRFEGIDDATSAQALHGADLSALKSDLPGLPPNTYRDEDLIGMCVTDARLGGLGAVTSIAHYPHADMLVVGDRSLLIPLLAVYGVEIDVAAGSISTSLPDGFEDL